MSGDERRNGRDSVRSLWRRIPLGPVLLLVVVVVAQLAVGRAPSTRVPLTGTSESFFSQLERAEVRDVRISDTDVTWTTPRGNENNAALTAVHASPFTSIVVEWLLPVLLFGGLWFFVMRRAGGAAGAAMQLPKGALLLGPPGCGKTLLARADPSVDLQTIAARTPGFTGADLANVVNEAALLAARAERPRARNRHGARHGRGVPPTPSGRRRRWTPRSSPSCGTHEPRGAPGCYRTAHSSTRCRSGSSSMR